MAPSTFLAFQIVFSMHEPAIVADLDKHLDIFGQQPSIDIYTQICSCYSVPDASLESTIIDRLVSGLQRLYASFPWLAGEVINEGSSEGNSGNFKIKTSRAIPQLVVKDLRHDPSFPPMDAMRQANFPFAMLDENNIAPRKTLPGSSDNPALDPRIVFIVQATFVTGGLLLTFVGQHQTMDMTGQGHIIHYLSKACGDEQFTSEELSSGNIARQGIIPLLDDSYGRSPELAHQIIKTSPTHPTSKSSEDQTASDASQKCTWIYFAFDMAALRALKLLATGTIAPCSSYISTDDALSAFIWQCVTRTRLPRLNSTVESTLARAVDVRRYLGISQTYLGLAQNMTYHTLSLRKLAEEPLGSIASLLRSSLDTKTSTLQHDTFALATFLDRTPDKKVVSFTANMDFSIDIALSSWAKLNCNELDFDIGLGKPEAVRRPQFDPVESLIYLMPRSLDGEIAVGMCLRDEDMERLRADKTFMKYARYIG